MAAWAWYALIPSIAHTKSRRHLRPKGWFSEREEKILVNRLLRDDPSKSMMHNRQMLTLKMFRLALADFDLWPLYILMVLVRVPSFTPELYFTLTLRSLGFSTMDANLLSIPPSVAFFITVSTRQFACPLKPGCVVAALSLNCLRGGPGVPYLSSRRENKPTLPRHIRGPALSPARLGGPHSRALRRRQPLGSVYTM